MDLVARDSTGQVGGNQDSTPASLSGFLATLIPVGLVSGLFLLVFLLLRRSERRLYSPRTFVKALRPEERSPELPNGLFNWIGTFFAIPDTYVLNHQSFDGYLLLRYLKMSVIICFVGMIVTFGVLFPVNATAGGGQQQLDILSMSNIPRGNNPRFYAHTFVGWAYFSFIWFLIARETVHYINLRQAYLLSPLYANRLSSRTVLFSSVPDDFLDESKLRALFGDKVQHVWVATECKGLEKLVADREKVAMKLEGAEVKLIKTALKNRSKAIKKGEHVEEGGVDPVDVNGESGSAASRWVPTQNRPTHRLKFLIGQKVDTINWCRAELERLLPLVEAEQAKHRAGEAARVSSVFVEFHTQADAQAAYQTVVHHQALHMSPRFIGVNPNEVIWANLRIKWWERILRSYASVSIVCFLVIFWSIPVALVGTLSNIKKLATISWLTWLNSIPPAIFGVISGLLPSVLLAVLMALLPMILRLLARLGGEPSLARVELRTQGFYFAFQVVQVFLVTTLSSSAAASGKVIANNPSSAPSILAQQLPTAANFYISYFLVQGLTLSSGAVLQLVGLILSRVLGALLDSTPRKMYRRFSTLVGLGWGQVFPIYTLLTVISITYSCIAPLMLLFSTVGLYLLYLANRYNLLYVYNATIDTKGLVYPKALQHTTTGIYLAVVCMVGLFGINGAVGPLILMVIFLIGMILFHRSMNEALGPLLQTVPLSLGVEEQNLLSALEADQSGRASDNPADLKLTADGVGPAPHARPTLFHKFFQPHIYADYATLRRLVPTDFAQISYDDETRGRAYLHPAIGTPNPVIWLPRDPLGISRQEVAHTSRVIPCSDEGASFDEKGKMVWDGGEHGLEVPIFEEKVLY